MWAIREADKDMVSDRKGPFPRNIKTKILKHRPITSSRGRSGARQKRERLP